MTLETYMRIMEREMHTVSDLKNPETWMQQVSNIFPVYEPYET